MDLFLHLQIILLQNLSFIIPYVEHSQGVGLADCGDLSSDQWQPICIGNFSSRKSVALQMGSRSILMADYTCQVIVLFSFWHHCAFQKFQITICIYNVYKEKRPNDTSPNACANSLLEFSFSSLNECFFYNSNKHSFVDLHLI